jgi:hypothetical protein
MKKASLLLIFLVTFTWGFSQDKSSIVMNNKLVAEYVEDYVLEALERGYDVEEELLNKVDYILILPEDMRVCELAKTDLDIKLISLDSRVKLDRLILKVNLYRELFYVLGVPYDSSSVIMDRKKEDGFSYAAFDDVDIMNIELSKLFSNIK